MFTLSESRGKEASGFASIKNSKLFIHKTPFTAKKLIKSPEFKNYFTNYSKSCINPLVTICHSRLVTNGYEQFNKNNQPVLKNGVCVVHNGIIVNQKDIWKSLKDEEKVSELDTELIPTIIGKNLYEGKKLKETVQDLYSAIYGMTSTAALFEALNCLLLATNNGSLYYARNSSRDAFIFASEAFILKSIIERNQLIREFNVNEIQQLNPNSTAMIDLTSLEVELSDISSAEDFSNIPERKTRLIVHEIENEICNKKVYINTSFEYHDTKVPQELLSVYEFRKEKISALVRCKNCILPETFPYIAFDSDGLCNYCNNYQKINYKGKNELKNVISQIKGMAGKHDCLMPFSGGRDSSFALHFVKEELGMNPLAFSYDWGMITDLARRNQARMCGKLGVEHILISADIRKKRDNIHKNVSAWLKKPHLGTIPLFMAGDKQYFYYANMLMKQNHLRLSILGENLLETTNFKSGFCGIKPQFANGHTYSLHTLDKIRMLFFYGKEFMLNTAYINSSIMDTLDAFKSYYVIEHQNLNFFNYIKWDEGVVDKTLIDEYNWEIDPGAKTTWRIGDGTAAFYNYIYYMVAGFTENDTFRSNQIREGDISREKALEQSVSENQPRWDSLKWYCNTIRIDFEETIQIINRIPQLYSKVLS